MSSVRFLFVVGTLLVLCACASAPVRYYTLVPAATLSTAGLADPCCEVDIRSLRIPLDVDRPEMVIRQSDAQLAILNNDLWSAPLRDEVRSALLIDIRHDLALALLNRSATTTKFLIFVDVSRFESRPADSVIVQAEWRLASSGEPGSAAPVCESAAKVRIGGGVSGVVIGYQQAISKIASSITTGLLAVKDGGKFACPSP